MKKSNIVLIGMPGAGKSTIGVILAKQLSFEFVDTDILIQTVHERLLQDIVDNDGHFALRKIEEDILCGLNLQHHVIATGGSAVYSQAAMEHLSESSITVFLDVSLNSLKQRINNYETRGLAKHPDQSFQELFEERTILYNKYADLVIKSDNIAQEKASELIAQKLSKAGLQQL